MLDWIKTCFNGQSAEKRRNLCIREDIEKGKNRNAKTGRRKLGS